MTFAPGMLVRQRNSRILLVVTDVTAEGVICVWYAGGQRRQKTCRAEALLLVDAADSYRSFT
ncbi:hypothetical protein [Mixta gaviniae]|uniref:Uncharacterized protein n=1 Tax=Mixta gaviniae TaxID=665914 RepID=A0A1X1D6C7_9GAMM|nr:hypothetical protein [Mixta gaviniae]AUX92219.1 hypothetical protein C2E15_03305 [Mixta gaviniae]ORM72252.1 hypothetical protein HA44_20505 [Mixta gaviniae]